MKNYYEVLGVARSATQEEIAQRYRFLAMAFHPDRFSNPASKEVAENEMKIINEAYSVLSDPEKRRRYDLVMGNFAAGTSSDRRSRQRPESEPDASKDETKKESSYRTKNEPRDETKESKKSAEDKENKTNAQTAIKYPMHYCNKCHYKKPAMELRFLRIISYILIFKVDDDSGYFCIDCIEELFWKNTTITLFLGWWGIWSFFLPLIIIPINVINYIRAWNLRETSDQLGNRAIGWKFASLLFLLFIAYSFMNRTPTTQYPDEQLTYSQEIAEEKASIEESEEKAEQIVHRLLTVEPVNLFVTPTTLPADCKYWHQVSATDKGRNLCVFGVVRKAYWGGNFYYIGFGDKPSDFRFVVTDGYYINDIKDKCVHARGTIKTYNEMPYIEVKDELWSCYHNMIYEKVKKE